MLMSLVMGIVEVKAAALYGGTNPQPQQQPGQAPIQQQQVNNPNLQQQQQQVSAQNPAQSFAPAPQIDQSPPKTFTGALSQVAGNALKGASQVAGSVTRGAVNIGSEIVQENRDELKGMLAARMLGTNYYPRVYGNYGGYGAGYGYPQSIGYGGYAQGAGYSGYPSQVGYGSAINQPQYSGTSSQPQATSQPEYSNQYNSAIAQPQYASQYANQYAGNTVQSQSQNTLTPSLQGSQYPTTLNQCNLTPSQVQQQQLQQQMQQPASALAPSSQIQPSADCSCPPPLHGTADITEALNKRKGPFSYPQVFLTSDPGTAPPLPLYPSL